jgi:hypothetical protein
VSPRATDTKAANGRARRHTTGMSRRLRLPRPPHRRSPSRRQGPGQCASADARDAHAQAERYLLRAGIALLTGLLVASVVHAVTDGLSPGLTLGLTLTTLLLLSLLELWRVGSRRKPDDAAPPGIER